MPAPLHYLGLVERYLVTPVPRPRGADSLDALLGQRSDVLHEKLQVIASEIWDRLRIRRRNLAKLVEDEIFTDNLILESLQTNPGADGESRRIGLYGRVLDLHRDHRREDVDCWRDVAMVMRDFIAAWEALEQSRSRAVFLNDGSSD